MQYFIWGILVQFCHCYSKTSRWRYQRRTHEVFKVVLTLVCPLTLKAADRVQPNWNFWSVYFCWRTHTFFLWWWVTSLLLHACMWWWPLNPLEWMNPLEMCVHRVCLCMPTCAFRLGLYYTVVPISARAISASYYSPDGRDSLVNQRIFFHSSRRLV